MTLETKSIQGHAAFHGPWYYKIELAKELYTPGAGHANVALTRKLLRGVDVEHGGPEGRGASCLDLGTQEGLISVLLERRGASEVICYDRVSRAEKFDLLRQALGVNLSFLGEMKLGELPKALAATGCEPFDVVVFSGVLYHMFDPLAGLAVARGLVRNGGILILETAGTLDQSASMHFNREGRFDPYSFWFVSPPCLDYLLRFLRLEVLETAYLRGAPGGQGTPPSGRVAVACRAVEQPLAEAGDSWITRDFAVDFAEFVDWSAAASDRPSVQYDAGSGQIPGPAGGIDLTATIEATPPHKVLPDEVRLDLSARY